MMWTTSVARVLPPVQHAERTAEMARQRRDRPGRATRQRGPGRERTNAHQPPAGADEPADKTDVD